jgi:PTH2 family peptidyl-tRNA hydrolase
MNNEEPELVMYFVVNSDLKMGYGKMAAQVAHAAIDAYERTDDKVVLQNWRKNGSAKVVLTAPHEKILELLNKFSCQCWPIYDQGRTQICPNSLTVLGFSIMPKGSNPDLCTLKLSK